MLFQNSQQFLVSFFRYVSTQYIYDCVEMNEQLNVEDYKLNPASVKRHSTRHSNNRESYATLLGGIMKRPDITFQQENNPPFSHLMSSKLFKSFLWWHLFYN